MTSALDRIGPDALRVTLAGQLLDLGETGAVTIRHGREAPDRQPDAGTCTLAVRRRELAALPSIGATLTVELGPDAHSALAAPAGAGPRFRGHVTDVTDAPYDPAGHGGRVLVTAVTRRARLGRVFVGDADWPAELDGARAARILTAAAAQAQLTVGTSDPGTFLVRARPAERASALELLDQLATSTGGVLAEQRSGALAWHDAEHRRQTTPAVTLDASDVLGPTGARVNNLSGVVNDLTVTYGADQTVQVVDPASADPVNGYGPLAASVSTVLADAAGAGSYARSTVGRRARPRWSTPGLTVDVLRSLDPAAAGQLLALEFGSLVQVSGPPLVTALLWLEGWTEQLSRTSWRVALDVSDYHLTGPPLRWQDVPPALTWAQVPAGLTWLGTHYAVHTITPT